MPGSRSQQLHGSAAAPLAANAGPVTVPSRGGTSTPGLIGAAIVPGEPPKGLLNLKIDWRTLPPGLQRDLLTRCGRWPDGTWMAVPALRGLRELALQNWRNSLAYGSADSENWAYWAMNVERLDQLIEVFSSRRGDVLRQIQSLAPRDDIPPEAKYHALQDLLGQYHDALHEAALATGDTTLGTGFEEAEIVSAGRTALLVAWNSIARARLQTWQADIDREFARTPAEDVMRRRTERQALFQRLGIELGGSAQNRQQASGRSSDGGNDGLPDCPLAVLSARVAVDRQGQLLGGGEPLEDRAAVEQMDRVVQDAVAMIKTSIARLAEVDLADARARLARFPRIEAGEPRLTVAELKTKALLTQVLQEMTQWVIGNERNRQLLGDSEPGSGRAIEGYAVGAFSSLNIGSQDMRLYRTWQETQQLLGPLQKGFSGPLQFQAFDQPE